MAADNEAFVRKIASYGQLVPVRVPTEEEEMLRSLQRRRHSLAVRIRSTMWDSNCAMLLL
jgi:hypothetical protein